MGKLDYIRIPKSIGKTSIDIDVWYQAEVEFPFKVKDNQNFRPDVREFFEHNKLILRTHLSAFNRYTYQIYVGLYRKEKEKRLGGDFTVVCETDKFYKCPFDEGVEKAKAHYQRALERLKTLQDGEFIRKNFLEDAIKDE